MATKDLSSAQMLGVTQAWLEPGPQRMLIGHEPALSNLLPLLQRVHDDLEGALLGDGERIAYATLTARLTALDARHDALARATFHAISACSTVSDDESLAVALIRARDALFPEGLDVEAPSILEELARAERAARVLDGPVCVPLSTVPLGEGTLLDAALAWIRVTRDMRGVWAKRIALADRGGGDAATIRRARLAWIRCVNAFSTLAQLIEMDAGSEVLLATLHEAEIAAMQQSHEVHSTLSGHGKNSAASEAEVVETDPELLRIFDSEPGEGR